MYIHPEAWSVFGIPPLSAETEADLSAPGWTKQDALLSGDYCIYGVIF